ncbi:MAG: alkaline phosphatase family protein [Nitrospirota bacterium]
MKVKDILCVLLYPSGALLFILSLLSLPAVASEVDLERDLQSILEVSRSSAVKALEAVQSGAPSTDEVARIKTLAEDIKASYLLLQERFKLREESIRALGPKALERHQAMVARYIKGIEDYLGAVDALSPDSAVTHGQLDNLIALLDRIVKKKKQPLLGALPYKNTNYPSNVPSAAPPIQPAYKGGNRSISPDDLKDTAEAPLSAEIATLAQSLNWNPVSIYEWVKNTVDTEWYWGCMKGAEETLRQKSGNDCDQAALLVALLRASGFPSRYVRGTIEFYPDIESVKNLTGIDDPAVIAEFFQKTGIPFTPVIAGGRIANFQVEHIWVESHIPYANYRGALIDDHGKAWLGLDTSIKAAGYTYNSPAAIPPDISLAEIREGYLGSSQTLTPLEYTRAYLIERLSASHPDITYNDLLWTRSLVPEVMNIIPASMQFNQKKITHEYTALPEEIKHRVKVTAQAAGNELFSITLDAHALSNRKIVLTYEPESSEDHEIINAYGGLDNTPSYLVRLRPVLKVEDERLIVGRDGLPMGADYDLTIELVSPNGVERIANTYIAGNLSVIGFVAQKAVAPAEMAAEEKNAERLMYEEALRYIDRWNQSEDELASLLHLVLARPAPTVAVVGGVVDVTYLLDTPHGFEWKGVSIDAALRAASPLARRLLRDRDARHRLFMQLSALQGSALEHSIFQDDFQVESISTAKLFGIAQDTQPSAPLITITSTNIAAVLPTFPFDENIKDDIRNAVNQRLVVHIPQSALVYEDWSGTGYIKENPETGEAGYMLSGMLAGGMTAWGLDRWPEYYAERLSNPYSEPASYDPYSAYYIQKITETDLQKGTVGEPLSTDLQVVVFTKKMQPLKGVDVIFTVKAGGGKFSNGLTTMIVKTDYRGVASAQLTLGEKTSANPTYWREPGNIYSQQIGENIVSAAVLSSGTPIEKPFTAYAFPKKPYTLKSAHGDGVAGYILTFSGFVATSVEDAYGNPVANIPVQFEMLSALDQSGCDNPNQDTRQGVLVETGDPCIESAPTIGQCATQNSAIEEVTDSTGSAAVQVILGAIPGAHYPIRATYGAQSRTFTHTTYNFGNCWGTADPSSALLVQYVYPADQYGNNIDAAKVGTEIPVMAKINFINENETTKEILVRCGEDVFVCNKIVGSRTYDTVTEFTAASVTFSGQPGAPAGGGVYKGTYTLAPGKNEIVIDASAAIEVTRTLVCPSCKEATLLNTQSSSITMEVYGVDMQVDPLPTILTDESGHTQRDITIDYTVSPADYQALAAFVIISKDGDPTAFIPMKTAWGDTGGKDTATLSKGFWFDANSTYEVEVVLNPGTGVEIRSEKRKISVAEVTVSDDTGKTIKPKDGDEVRFGDGNRAAKRYYLDLKSAVLAESCDKLTGRIRVVDKNGEIIAAPGPDYSPSEYELDFSLSDGKCIVKVKDAGEAKQRFIISNLPKAALVDRPADFTDIAVLYGGIGNKLEIEIEGARRGIPIEPVGVIVIGVDGLRQDVLYPPDRQDVNDPYGNYYVDPAGLPGLGQLLVGSPQDPATQQYIMLPKVTAIFPSITLASWASIFTGKMPRETGILGNEFFARDLNFSVPQRFNNPAGIVSFDGGAFRGYSSILPFSSDFFIPYQSDWRVSASASGTPQNDVNILKPKTLFESINEIPEVRKYFSDKGGDPVVVASSHYARGAHWLTWDIEFRLGESELLDQASWDKLDDYLTGKYRDGVFGLLGRNKVPFSALTVWYIPGLDHKAHFFGLDGYRSYFISNTDMYIKKMVARLKELDEFDNKIFIIVADHGHTAMPTNMTYRDRNWLGVTVVKPAEISCKLKLNLADPLNPEDYTSAQKAELANNNLHIWELAEMLKSIGELGLAPYKVLAPKEIADLYKVKDRVTGKVIKLPYGAAERSDEADLIVGLNGPMAHVYVTNKSKLGNIAELLRLALSGHYPAEALKWWDMDGLDYLDLKETAVGRLKASSDKILVRVSGDYCVFGGVNDDGSPKCASVDPFVSSEYVNAWERTNGMNHTQRSGDIVLVMKDDMGDINQRYTTGVACKSWHGSLNRSDSYVPFIFAYPGGSKLEIDKILQKDTLCRTGYSNCKGNWNLTDIVNETISAQYQQED